MNALATEKTMTIREIGRVLGKDESTIRKIGKELFPSAFRNGVKTFLTEAQVTAIKLNLGKNSELPKTDLEKELLIQQAMMFQQEKINALQGKADQFDRLSNAEGLFLPRQAGKTITGKPNLFSQWLIDSGICYRLKGKLTPKQDFQDRGYFVVKESLNESQGKAYPQTYITPKGMTWLDKRWEDYQSMVNPKAKR